ncbi:L,D-transpeptidase [Maritalea sp.]|jgi:lipoprotein-anchoring transpeptidase ErfK/SrfK|uniref:L,D-transpeptidase n=1 Tax=Maritalea sp. TaxID=2003361 RepID=UPI0039E6ACDC
MKAFRIGVAFLLSAVLLTLVTTTAQAKRVYDPIKKEWYDTDDVKTNSRGGSKVKRQEVAYETKLGKGTIVVETSERRLYFVLGNGRAIRYGVGVGREGFQWSGTNRISRKAEWPGWTPPPAMRKRVPGLPAYMPGGPKNPLGARALYIGSTLYRLHGTSEPWTIGQAVSSGCIRLVNSDIIDLYERAKVGAKVIVRR